jgi:diketogulonate reductase-like aldo/keto reductase
MAYSPVEQGELLRNKAVKRIASKVGATPAQLCLAWVLRQPNVIAIPKAGTREHVRENHASLAVQLTDVELQALDDAFPPPREPRPLEMI